MLHHLPGNATKKEILSAGAATLRISNQTNWHVGACVHHGANLHYPVACPVIALAWRVAHIRQHTTNGKAFLCTYFDEAGRTSVTNDQISFTVKFAVKTLKYGQRGIPIDRIDTHSL